MGCDAGTRINGIPFGPGSGLLPKKGLNVAESRSAGIGAAAETSTGRDAMFVWKMLSLGKKVQLPRI